MTNLLIAFLLSLAQDPIKVDADFPGGNIIVDKIDGDTVSVQQDLRDTAGEWFYWQFRVRGAQGRAVTFQFSKQVLGVLGPAFSLDQGESWNWLGKESVKGNAFKYSFPADAQDVRNHRNDRNDHKFERRHHRREFRRHHEAPRLERYWVPARTESVFAGYDHCGKPIYRTVCVPGYWATRPICD